MNGKELYHWIKEKHPRLVNRVIFTTGDVIAKDIQPFLSETARRYLPKPFTPDELRTVVRQAFKELE
jgi:DNA-binding NarL/FixJ family response regulator